MGSPQHGIPALLNRFVKFWYNLVYTPLPVLTQFLHSRIGYHILKIIPYYKVYNLGILLIFRGAIASLGPTIIAQQFGDTESVLDNLARLQSWRDLGAAAGPMVTGFALVYISAEIQHLVLAIIFGIVLILSSPKIRSNSN